MRATMRITWLLLSLSFLFHHVCSDDASQTDTSVSTDKTGEMAGSNAAPAGGDASETQPNTDSKAMSALTTRAPTTDGKKYSTVQAPTTAKPTFAVTTTITQISAVATSKPTDKPVTSQTQANTVTEKAATPAVISDTVPAEKNDSISATATATPNEHKTLTQAATPNGNGGSMAAAGPATVQTSETSGSSNTSGTEAPAVSSGNTINVESTKMSKASTDAPSSGKQSTAQTITTSKMSQEDNKGGTKKETETATSPKQNSSSPPNSAGNPGTTSTPSNPTKDGPLVTDPLGTKAGTTALQTTSIPNHAKVTSTATTTATTNPTATATTDPTDTATTNPRVTATTTSTTTTTTTSTTATTAAQPKTFLYSLNKGQPNKEEKELVELCRRLMVNLKDGNCSLAWKHSNGTIKFDRVEINGMVKTDLASQYFEEITKKPTDNKTLIAILASCGALLIMIVILAVCASHHRKPYNENQQHLTEELHTVENGYHDNPTLEVMEVQPEMQEKKMVLNGEFNDSWIVPIDNLLKEDMPDEEDTHL